MVKGPYAICPATGADLSEDRHPDERGIQYREPETARSDVLSTGKTHSSRHALTTFFTRNHRKYADDMDDGAPQRAAEYLRALKSETDARDEWVWYALCERLHRDDFDVAWMRMADVVLVCPHCGSWLKYRPSPDGERLLPKCGVACTKTSEADSEDFVFGDICEEIRTTYNEAFADTTGEYIEPGSLHIA